MNLFSLLSQAGTDVYGFPLQAKLEAQYAAKRDVQLGEISDLRQQLETRAQQNRDQATTIDSLKGVNEELKVSAIPRL